MIRRQKLLIRVCSQIKRNNEEGTFASPFSICHPINGTAYKCSRLFITDSTKTKALTGFPKSGAQSMNFYFSCVKQFIFGVVKNNHFIIIRNLIIAEAEGHINLVKNLSVFER